MDHRRLRNSFLLLITATIWGVAFVAQSVGMEYMGPFSFNAIRFLLGGTALLPVLYRRGKSPERREALSRETREERRKRYRITAVGGVCCGLALCSASALQQIGIQYTTVAKAGFITALYIVLVPLMGLFVGKRVRGLVWCGVLLAVLGMYLLCINGSFRIGKGDAAMFVCAMLFSIHILVIDHFSPKADGVALSCIQFYVSGLISGAVMLFTETLSWTAVCACAVPILYAGFFSCGVAYTLQIIGQKGMDPAVASLILSLESVISLLAGWIILGQALSRKEICGCFLVFSAIVLVQLPQRK